VDLYSQSKRIAEYGLHQAGGELDLGYEFNRSNQLRAGYTMGYQGTALRIGSPALPTATGQLSSTSVRYNLITVDNPVIPRSGVSLTSGFQYIDHAPNAGGGFYAAQLNAIGFHRVSKPGSVFLGADGGSTFGHEGGVPQFFLGSSLRLGAYGRNEILTNQFFLFRGGYIHELASLPPLLGDKIYGLAYYEIAKAYGGNSPSRLPMDVNSGVVINSLIGPLFLGGAYGDTGHRKIYFQLGRIF
jgi:NTE family protein